MLMHIQNIVTLRVQTINKTVYEKTITYFGCFHVRPVDDGG